jgi:uncharacterized RDD family membrane protein YckC
MRPTSSERPFGHPVFRLIAYTIDMGLVYTCAAGGAIFGAFLASLMVGVDAPAQIGEEAALNGAYLGWMFWGCTVWFLNYGVIQGMLGGSLGKLLFGLRVVMSNGAPIGMAHSLGRTIAYLASALPFYLGFAAIFWNKDRQCWHDRMAGTVVIRKTARFPEASMGHAASDAPVEKKESVFPHAA